MIQRWFLTFYILGCVGSVGLMAGALYFEYVLYLDPCPLCMAQRIVTILLGVGCLVGFALQRFPRTEIVALVLLLALALLGVYLAHHHVWIQHLPEDQVPQCGPGLDYMLETLPLKDVLISMLQGDGECAHQSWSWLGWSMPQWLRLVFVAYACAAAVFLVLKIRLLGAQSALK